MFGFMKQAFIVLLYCLGALLATKRVYPSNQPGIARQSY